jgi:hypothetical protein
MKKETLLLAASVAGIVAAAAVVLSPRVTVGPDRLAGLVTILMLVGIAAVEYRIDWKRLLNVNRW